MLCMRLRSEEAVVPAERGLSPGTAGHPGLGRAMCCDLCPCAQHAAGVAAWGSEPRGVAASVLSVL